MFADQERIRQQRGEQEHRQAEALARQLGNASVTIPAQVGEEEKLVGENQSVYIVATQWHRLENPGKTPLEMIEVQIGSYLGEDDIVRADDIYNRTPDETK
jgi:mannose-1-phosphate guanylyltransferase/mannose-6-phosphate isomerase